MSNKLYDALKDVAQIYLPALATLVIAICSIWGLPYGEAIGATIIAIDTFLGAVLKISTSKYNSTNEEG